MDNQPQQTAVDARQSPTPQFIRVRSISNTDNLINPKQVSQIQQSHINILTIFFATMDGTIQVRGTLDSWEAAIRVLRLNPNKASVRLREDYVHGQQEPDLNDIIPDEEAVKA